MKEEGSWAHKEEEKGEGAGWKRKMKENGNEVEKKGNWVNGEEGREEGVGNFDLSPSISKFGSVNSRL